MYTMREPIAWAKFKGYPKEMQKEYLQWFADEFHATPGMMAEVFGINRGYASTVIKKMGLSGILCAAQNAAGVVKFNEWMKQQKPEVEEVPVPEEPKKEKVKVVEQPMFFHTITGCEMSMEGKASEIGQTLFSLFRDQKIVVNIVFVGAKDTENAEVD